MGKLIIDNYKFELSLKDALERLRLASPSGKLNSIGRESDSKDNLVVTCPFHDGGHERKPACNIYNREDGELPYGYFRCFVCGEKGNLLKLASSCLEASKEKTLEWFKKNFKYEETGGINFSEDISIFKSLAAESKKSEELNESCLDAFQSWHPYFAKRGLSRATCEQFKLRYDSANRQVVFPYFDETGKLITLLKRSIDTKTFYVDENVKMKPVYGINAIIKSNSTSCLLTEGPFDCLLSNQYGIPAAALLGEPSEEQVNLINKLNVNIIYLMFDNDFSGRKFNRFMHNKLSKRFIIKDVLIQNPYKDIGDLDEETFWKFINKANENTW